MKNMPDIGDRVRVTFRDGRTLEGIVEKIYTEYLIYLHVVIRLDSGKTIDLCINDVSEGVKCVETI